MTKKEFFARGNECFFLDDPKGMAGYCREHWPENCAKIIQAADRVCRNEFLFDLPHDLEMTLEPVCFGEGCQIDWEYCPHGDPEFTYQFNRHRYFISLGQAYQLTGDEKYARQFFCLLTDWIQRIKHTPESEKTAWRILEAGFRGEYWVKAIRYFADSPLLTDEIVDQFYRCLKEHGEYIIQMHSPYRYISNWGVLENHGLFEIGIAMPDEEERKRYTSIALEHLEIQARMQILGDGVQWEQSPMYHNEVLHCFEDVLILAFRNGIQVPEAILQAVKKMAYVNLSWRKPDGHEFMMGDSDDMDIQDYTGVAAYLFKDPVLKFGGRPVLGFESLWDVGLCGSKEYEAMEAKEPEALSAALEDSGNYYLRSSWEKDGNVLHFHCGTMGAGHGHSDKLHVDLVIGGEDILTDSGRYSYAVDKGRFDFKDPKAHNTITVDGKDFTVCKDSWECTKLCQPVKQLHKFTEQYEFIQGGHLGYMEEPGGVFVNRKVLWIKPDLYIIMDELYTGDRHSYEQYWNFSEKGRLELSDPAQVRPPKLPGLDQAANPDPTLHKADGKAGGSGEDQGGNGGGEDPGRNGCGHEGGLGTPPVQTALFTAGDGAAKFFFMTPGIQAELAQGKVSRHYNQWEARPVVKVSAKGDGFVSLLTVIQGGEAGKLSEKLPDCTVEKLPVKSALKGIYYPPSMAEGVKIRLEGKEYVVIICHQEVNSPTDLEEVDGCLGYGNVIVFEPSKSRKAGTVMCW